MRCNQLLSHIFYPRRLAFLVFVALLNSASVATEVKLTPDTTVYSSGGKRVHVKGCNRLLGIDWAMMQSLRYEDAQVQGLKVCTKCPIEGSGNPYLLASEMFSDSLPPDTIAYRNFGDGEGNCRGIRGHIEGCPRLDEERAEGAKFDKITIAEAQIEGLPPCTKCPVERRAEEASTSESIPEPEIDENVIAPDTIVYADGSGNRVHVADCIRMPTDSMERAFMTKLIYAEAIAQGYKLCSSCPGSTTPKDERESKPREKKAPTKIVYTNEGGKRCHVEGCPRMPSDPKERAAMIGMPLEEAKAKGLEPCSKCPVSENASK